MSDALTQAQSPHASAAVRLIDALVRRRWLSLSVVAVIAFAAHLVVRDWSWHFLVEGVHALFSPTGLRLYSLHPDLQMGPLTFVLGALFVLVLHGPVGMIAGNAFMMLVGLVAVQLTAALVPANDRNAVRRWFIASVLVLGVWAEIAVHWGHLDDAMALLGGVVALRLMRAGHPLFAALAVGLAIDFKPWAVPFAAVLLLVPWRRLLLPALILVVTVGGAWGVFALLDPSMISALHYTITVNPASTIGLFHLATTTPWWCRPAQLLGGALLAAIAVKRGQWPAVLLIAIAVRMLLDPVAKNYYDSGLVLGAAVFDIVTATGVLPLMTLVAVVTVYLPSYLLDAEPVPRAIIRTLALLALLIVAYVRRGGLEGSALDRGAGARRTARPLPDPQFSE